MSKVSIYLVCGTLLTAFGSSMLFGYNLTVLTLPEKYVKEYLTSRDMNATEQKATALYSIATSAFLGGGVIGASLSGFASNTLGRRNGLIVNNFVVVLSSIIIFISYETLVPELFYLARALLGASSAISQTVASMYLTEIAPIRWRGFLGACHMLALVSGCVLGNLMTFEQVLGGEKNWIIAAGLVGAPALIEALFHWMLPESPRHLYFIGSINQAKEACKKYDPQRTEEDFVEEMVEEMKALERDKNFRFLDIFSRTYRKPMLITCLMQVQLEFSGITVIEAYTSLLLSSAGVLESNIQYWSLGFNALTMVCTLSFMPLLERYGRKTLFLLASALISLWLAGLGVSVQHRSSRVATLAAIVFMYLHAASVSLGIGSVAVLIASEIFRQGPRGAAYSVSQVVQWSLALLLTLVYPNVEKILNGIIYFIFMAVVIINSIVLYIITPETKQRAIEDICVELEQPIELQITRSSKKNQANGNNEQTVA